MVPNILCYIHTPRDILLQMSFNGKVSRVCQLCDLNALCMCVCRQTQDRHPLVCAFQCAVRHGVQLPVCHARALFVPQPSVIKRRAFYRFKGESGDCDTVFLGIFVQCSYSQQNINAESNAGSILLGRTSAKAYFQRSQPLVIFLIVFKYRHHDVNANKRFVQT